MKEQENSFPQNLETQKGSEVPEGFIKMSDLEVKNWKGPIWEEEDSISKDKKGKGHFWRSLEHKNYVGKQGSRFITKDEISNSIFPAFRDLYGVWTKKKVPPPLEQPHEPRGKWTTLFDARGRGPAFVVSDGVVSAACRSLDYEDAEAAAWEQFHKKTKQNTKI